MKADIYKCACGYGWDKSKVVRHHFCPNCGRAVDSTELEPCTDAISRQAVLNLPRKALKNYFGEVIAEVVYVKDVIALPPVTPAEKVGQWEYNPLDMCFQCSQCKCCCEDDYKEPPKYKYCPQCGAKMQEGDAE